MIYCLTGTFANCSQTFDFPLRDVRKITLLGIATDGYSTEPVVILRFRDFPCSAWKPSIGFTDYDAVVPMGAFALMYPQPLPLFEGQIGILPGISVTFLNTANVSLASGAYATTKISIWLEISDN